MRSLSRTTLLLVATLCGQMAAQTSPCTDPGRTPIDSSPDRDVEPALVASPKPDETVKTALWMRFEGSPRRAQVHFETWATSGARATGRLTATLPGSPATVYAASGDPALASDPTHGVLWAAASVYIPGSFAPPGPNAIAVWKSTDGGSTWGAATVVNAAPANSCTWIFLDKPSLAVASNGDLFLSFTRDDREPTAGRPSSMIRVLRHPWNASDGVYEPYDDIGVLPPSCYPNGDCLHPADACTRSLGDAFNNSVVLTDSSSAVATVFLDQDHDQVAIRRNGAISRVPQPPGTGGFYGTANSLPGGFRSFTIPAARWNPATGLISIAWHQRAGQHDDHAKTFLIAYNPVTNTFVPSAPVAVDAAASANSSTFMPAIAHDAQGLIGVAFLRAEQTESDVAYLPMLQTFRYEPGLANLLPTGGATPVDDLVSNPAMFQSLPTTGGSFLGDYIDLRAVDSNTWELAWTGAGAGHDSDVFLSAIPNVTRAVVTGGGLLCAGNTAVIRADFVGQPPFTYQWSDEVAPSSTASYHIERRVSPAEIGTYHYSLARFSDATGNGCTRGSATVWVTAPPDPTIRASACSVTSGSSGNIAWAQDYNGAATYRWGILNGNITAGIDTSVVTFTAGPSGVVELTLIVTKACARSASLRIGIDQTAPATPVLKVPDAVAAGSYANVAKISNPSASPLTTYTWTLLGGQVVDGQGTATITFAASGYGDVGITALAANPCGEATGTASVGIDNAFFAGQSVPEVMTAGSSGLVSVSMRNHSNRTWTEGDLYRLGSQSPPDNVLWGSARVPLAPAEAIGPEAIKTFNFGIVAPAIAGLYPFDWQMVRDGRYWLGQHNNPWTIAVDPVGAFPNANPVSQTSQGTLNATTFRLTIMMRNTGTSTWSTADHALSLETASFNGWAPVTIPLPQRILTGEDAVFVYTINPSRLLEHGRLYRFQWRMVRGGVPFGQATSLLQVRAQ